MGPPLLSSLFLVTAALALAACGIGVDLDAYESNAAQGPSAGSTGQGGAGSGGAGAGGAGAGTGAAGASAGAGNAGAGNAGAGNAGTSSAGKGGASGAGFGGGGQGGVAGKCAGAIDCNDKNPCTKDECAGGECKHVAQPGASCADDDKCDGSEVCDASGACQPGKPLVIDDGKVCTQDKCDPATGTVTNELIAGCSCEKSSDCDDGNPCTNEECKPNGTTGKNTCVSSAVGVGAPCDDKNPCTLGDQCAASGACEGKPKDTSDGDPCTIDSCDPVSGLPTHTLLAGCVPCGSDAECAGGNACASALCNGGKCQLLKKPDGEDCDDKNACTVGDKCAGGVCGGVAIFCASPPNLECYEQEGSCSPATGLCQYNLKADGAPCGGDLCAGSVCKGGSCVPGAKVECPSICSNGLTSAGTCDAATGKCGAEVSSPCSVACSGKTLSTGACDASGKACQAIDCPGQLLCGSVDKCFSACDVANSDSQCAEGHYCAQAADPFCTPKRGPGASCNNDVQCLSLVCNLETCQ